jgi:hypothetical protein
MSLVLSKKIIQIKKKQSGFAWKQITGSSAGQIPSRQKSPPLVPLGLHGLFVGLRTIHASLFFSVTLFAKGKKDVCTPTATTVLHLRQKKNNSKLLYITCSYIRALA